NGLSEVLQEAGFEVYPNPAQNTLTLRMDMPYSQLPALECHLYNLKGEALAFQHWAHPADTLQIDVSNFAAGVYVLVLRAGREVMTKKMIIE
ncbi:MAG: T9SS type A sorting domain-containing protein, partial [Phaeodactylibacter sp.]|nr:T9SS type A sorting domain-containing protein [Phaeodactylibacter sp.]